MKTHLAFVVFLIFVSAPGRAGDTGLFQLQVQDPPSQNIKTVNMSYQEIARDAGSSTVEVRFVSGASVAASMFVLRGSCGVARARGEKYFRWDEVSKNPIRFRLRFPREATEQQLHPKNKKEKIFSVEECARIGF